MVKIKAGEPSEPDHPLFGLMDPGRAAAIRAMTPATSSNRVDFAKPDPSGYQKVRSVDPFGQTVDLRYERDSWKMSEQLSTTQASYRPVPSSFERAQSMKGRGSGFKIE